MEPSCVAGELYAWGLAGVKEKGLLLPVDGARVDAAGDCSYPARVAFVGARPLFTRVSADSGTFAAISDDGSVWGWAAHSPKDTPAASKPTPKQRYTPAPHKAVAVATGHGFTVVVLASGEAIALRSDATGGSSTVHVEGADGGAPCFVGCDAAFKTVCLWDSRGALFRGDAGKVAKVELPPGTQVVCAGVGSVHAAAVTSAGGVFCWGANASGCLGTGDRKARRDPVAIPFFGAARRAASVACTKGQPVVSTSVQPGAEGPRTHVVTEDGKLYIAGTSHKGLAADHLQKTFMPSSDHLTFYEVGGPAADAHAKAAVPTGAAEDLKTDPAAAAARMGMVGPERYGLNGDTGYLGAVAVVKSVPAHIHSAALGAGGALFMWGCGSNGRCGLLAFHRGPGGAKRKLKCYVSTPTAVEYFADRGMRVLDFAVGRYWTVAIVRPAP